MGKQGESLKKLLCCLILTPALDHSLTIRTFFLAMSLTTVLYEIFATRYISQD